MEGGPPNHLELEFHNISYVPPGQDNKQILKDVNGRFRPFHVTAILGPSGAGKTTLLNILTGNRTVGVQGSITVNGQPIQRHHFRKQCCYISQHFAMLGLLTVRETLYTAAHFKLPGNISSSKRKHLIEERVNEVMATLGITEKMNSQVRYLSGGEMKRLSIGVELITNPPIMFFDEPTSGLDSNASLLVMKHLQSLAKAGGVTVIVVIHQPSSRCFQHCDDVFLLSKGRCLYNGPSTEMAKTFSDLGYECPQFFNIAEFAVEVACMEEGKVTQLITKAQDSHHQRSGEFFNSKKSLNSKVEDSTGEMSPMIISEDGDYKISIQRQSTAVHTPSYPISSFAQFCILLWRCTICINRDMHLFGIRLLSHIVVSFLLGILFYDFGRDADKINGTFSFIFFNVLFLFFATAMPTICTFPFEADVFIREQSNNWYPTRVYYIAKVLADLPLQIICPTIFVAVTWFLTGQPMELHRFCMLWLISVMIAVLAQTVGNAAGAAFTVQNAVFIVPSSTIPLFLLSGFFVTLKNLYYPFQVMAKVSYFKFAFEGSCQSVFGYDRPKLPCSKPYCHYRHPGKFLQDIGMSDYTYGHNILCIVLWVLLMQLLLFCVLKWKVSKAKT